MNLPPSAYDLPEDETGWQPGDPIHQKPAETGGYRFRALYNFREDTTGGDCGPCADSAQWPEPKPGTALRGVDELEELIMLTHRDARRAELNGDVA